MKNQFEIKSLRERLLLKEFLDTQICNSQIKYSPYDGNEKYDATWIQFNQSHRVAYTTICEVKVRLYPMAQYDGWLIEKDKYDYLMAQDFDKKLYINFHPDGIQIWDLNKISEPEWNESALPSNNQSNEQRLKINGDLMKVDSLKLNKIINIQEAYEKAERIYLSRQNKSK